MANEKTMNLEELFENLANILGGLPDTDIVAAAGQLLGDAPESVTLAEFSRVVWALSSAFDSGWKNRDCKG